ncbi:hypothetical protein BD779DRAFT_1548268 [Infundibulicybe gibba]|nr:hypothetical protein BD779DRAFT_1548268 [Infundibulicybe gibba]
MTSSATLPSPVVIPHEVGSETDLNTTGPIFVGLILNWCLLGCLVVQVYIYYLSSRGDRAGLKFLVCFVSILDMAQTGVATEYAWRLLVVYNHPFDEPDDPEVSIYLPMINGIISAAVQVFFAWRIWSLNRALAGRVAAIFISLIALMQALSCIIAPNIPVDPLPDSGGPIYLVTLLWLVSNVVGDILIAAFMLYTLRKARCQSLSQGVETILSRLMVNTIETGVITAIVASLGLVLFLLGTGYDQPM